MTLKLKCARFVLLLAYVDMSASSARAKTISSVSDVITLSATKLSVELKEKQREALLRFLPSNVQRQRQQDEDEQMFSAVTPAILHCDTQQ